LRNNTACTLPTIPQSSSRRGSSANMAHDRAEGAKQVAFESQSPHAERTIRRIASDPTGVPRIARLADVARWSGGDLNPPSGAATKRMSTAHARLVGGRIAAASAGFRCGRRRVEKAPSPDKQRVSRRAEKKPPER